MTPVLRFAGVEKTFPDGTAALTELSFSVATGEFVAVVGPSGCGKSTLLRLASRLIRPTRGTVECAVSAESIGYVFQDPTLLSWRNVSRNVELLLELRGFPREERAQRAREVLELVGLNGFERHRPRALSGGMRMRVSLARALTMRPTLFLFDEPFGSLDVMTRERLNEALMRLFFSEGFAAVFVTHSVSEAVYLSHRVLVMSTRPGRVTDEFVVPFGFPRPVELRFESQFVELGVEVARALHREW